MTDHGNVPRARLRCSPGSGSSCCTWPGPPAVSGRASILASSRCWTASPLTPYRWVVLPPDLAASNKPPASTRFTLELTPNGSRLGASRPATVRSTWS